jgi:hypothetical protein
MCTPRRRREQNTQRARIDASTRAPAPAAPRGRRFEFRARDPAPRADATRATRASPSQGELNGKNAVDAAKDLATIEGHLNKKHKPSRGYYGHGVSVEVKVGKK